MSELTSNLKNKSGQSSPIGKKCIYWPLPEEDIQACFATITGVFNRIESVPAKYSIDKLPFDESILESQITLIENDNEKNIALVFIQNVDKHELLARKWFDSIEAPGAPLQFELKDDPAISLDFNPRRGWSVMCNEKKLAITEECVMQFAIDKLVDQLKNGST